ncbi:bifunctional lysylphosphatidylglycerol flippase/synthetase MprF [Nitratireductor sp. XY-223]|uniref:bifunctional lysylphosphatidylglycerol flippase/synthetase MprF n=1 Tax=Nitratireductor sp. XY-223 TaxID=2561926 RepID=UPI0010AB44EB|nr:bifunctional lysylphosphatidylglycerol flippase/synthetase MprF [Nitratireductor sp. XY-223]
MAQQKHGINVRTVLTGVFAIAITVFSFYLLHHFTADMSLADVVRDIRQTPTSHVLLAVLATSVSFTAIAFYEILAVRTAAPGRVSYLTAAWAGVAGFAISDVAGFHVLTGGALRYRVYSQKGLEVPLIGHIVALSWMSLWLGMAFTVGTALALFPGGALVLNGLPTDAIRAVGFAVLALFALYILWVATGRRSIAVRGLRVGLPAGGTSVLMLVAGVVDIGASATTLYILLPADAVHTLSGFFVVYMSAVILGAISHSPGGLGVFEATMMAGLGVAGRSDVLGALLLYRFIYYFLPLVPVSLTLLFLEVARGHRAIRQSVREIGRASEPLVPPIAAGVTFVGGLVLLLSGSLPDSAAQHEWIRSVLPLPFVESSHLLASMVGLALLVVAHALLRRRESAFYLAIALLGAGAVFALTKGLDYEEAVLLVAIVLFLLPFRSAFYRKSGGSVLAVTPAWLSVMAITVAAAVWLGFFAYRHVEYSNQLWWEFSWSGDAPRFLRTSVAVVAALFALGLHMILNRRTIQVPALEPVPDSVRRLVDQSPDPDSTIALLGDKHFLVSEDESAFLMYGVSGGSFISKGDPVGDRQEGEALAWRFREMADESGYRTVFYAAKSDYLPLYLDMGLSILKIGEVARVDLSTFTLDVPQQKDMRYARRRAEKDGLSFAIVPKEDIPPLLPELKQVSDAWLSIKTGGEKRFALGYFKEDYLSCFDCAVVRKDGEVVAFANILRGAQKNEMSVDLMRYRPKVSPVMMDFLFAEVLLDAQAEGYKWFDLGAAPLAGLADHPLATSWNRIGTMIYQHGEEFYHFEGLRAFKEKFGPAWSPNYLACPGGFAVPKVLIDVTTLLSGGRLKAVRR